MSNPSIASKLMTLVKGVIGPKKPATATSSAPAPAEDTPTEAEQKPGAAADATSTEEPADATAGEATETGGSTDSTDTAESADPVRGEEKSALADELADAEAQTRVASEEVFDQVRRESAPSAEELPVPNYDELTLPSIRGRLRKLSMEQVRELRAYEVANQGRQEFTRMYDNRIEKLKNEGQ